MARHRSLLPVALFGAGLVAAHAELVQDRPAPRRHDPERFLTSRVSPVDLPLPEEQDAFFFVVFGDRTGGPAEGIRVLEEAVGEVNLLEPDLVMTVGDLVEGYNQTPEWMAQMREYKGVMDGLSMPWFPVAGNHDVYWRGPDRPEGEHEADYEAHFGPLWYAFRHKTAWFVALYSDEGDPATGEKSFNKPAAQRMSDAQIAFLAETLERARGADHVFLFLHHPRWLGGNYGDDWGRVHALLAAAGNVTAVFAGHIHRMRYDGVRDGIEYFTLATVGGGQPGDMPAAGYLHQYEIVTVRKDGIAVASLPVGTVADPRKITGEVSEDARLLAGSLIPEIAARIPLAADLSAEGELELRFVNPARNPVELTVAPHATDASWRLAPEHQHVVIQPGAEVTLPLRAARAASALAPLELPVVSIQADYVAEGLRVPIPDRAWPLPVDPSALPEPAGASGALALDGSAAHVRVEHEELALPDGPFTLEAWVRADGFQSRQGLINKTENCEFGLFANDGVPNFVVHLGGNYVDATDAATRLAPGRWYHLAGVFDGGEVRLYVDGGLVARTPASGARTLRPVPLLVGADVDDAGNANSHFQGLVDELRVSAVARYSGPFTPLERFEPDDDTLLLLHLDAEVGPWVFDASGRRAHALRMGGARVVARE